MNPYECPKEHIPLTDEEFKKHWEERGQYYCLFLTWVIVSPFILAYFSALVYLFLSLAYGPIFPFK